MNILVINGPNLNFLGIREPSIYGEQSYDDLCREIRDYAFKNEINVKLFQSNHEGAIIDEIQNAYTSKYDGIVINPGALAHYSYALYDALKSVNLIKVEVHLSNINAREDFRRNSVTAKACDRMFYGHGFKGYLYAIDYIKNAAINKSLR